MSMVVRECAAPPAQQQPQREGHDHEPDRDLRALLDARGEVRLPHHDRYAEEHERRCMPEAPRQPESRCAAAAVGDERRHGGEVVGVARMAQAEQHGQREHEQQGGPVREMDEPVVETEHHMLTFGKARATIATPARTMTSALSTGRTFTTRPRPSKRANADFASTATSPTAVIATARPMLNATTSSIPNATRCSEIAASRTTRAD